MGAGTASLGTFQKMEGGGMPGPPFAPASADNGLSVDPVTGRIVLGNDVGLLSAQLLTDRELPMNGKKFSWLDALNRQFVIDPSAGFYGMGDLDTSLNGSVLKIDDPGQVIDLGAILQGNLEINMFPGDGKLQFDTGTVIALSLNSPAKGYSIGDTFFTDNGTVVNVNDDPAFRQIQLLAENSLVYSNASASSLYLNLNPGTSFYEFGDLSLANNGTLISLDDSIGTITLSGANRMQYADALGNLFLSVAPAVSQYIIGDINTSLNGTKLTVDDLTQQIVLAAVNGVNINGNNGFTGTVSPVTSITVDGGIVTAVS